MMGCFGCLIGGCDERSSADFFLICRELYKISKQHTLCFNKIEYKFKKYIFFSNGNLRLISKIYNTFGGLICMIYISMYYCIGYLKIFHQSNQYSIKQTIRWHSNFPLIFKSIKNQTNLS